MVSGTPALGLSTVVWSALGSPAPGSGTACLREDLLLTRGWIVMVLVLSPSLLWHNKVSAPVFGGAFSKHFLSKDRSTVPGVGETRGRGHKPCRPLGETAPLMHEYIPSVAAS